MSESQWVVIDDTHSAIVYKGPWAGTDGIAYNGRGNFGKTYNNTLHGITTAGSLSFRFKGTGGRLFGTTDIKNISGVIDPTWDCFVDKQPVQATKPFPYTENNWSFCSWDNLDDKEHTFTLNITSQGTAFWFDRIQYIAGSGTKLDRGTILVDRSDPSVHLDSNWVPLGDIGYMTQTKGATARYKFKGARLTWVGTIPTELPHTPTTATYTIDDEAPVRFTLPGLPSEKTSTEYFYTFFQTEFHRHGEHDLVVRYEGDSSTTPLVLGSFLIDNETPAGWGPADQKGGATPWGVIIGTVLGGLALGLFAIVGFICFRRRSQRRHQAYKPILVEEPFHFIRPFTLVRPIDPYEATLYSYTTGTTPSSQSNITPYPFSNPPYQSSVLTHTTTTTSQTPLQPAPFPTPISKRHERRAELAAQMQARNSSASGSQASGQPISHIPLSTIPVSNAAMSSHTMSASGNLASPGSMPWVLIHQDSGLRMEDYGGGPPTTPGMIIEQPPMYTS